MKLLPGQLSSKQTNATCRCGRAFFLPVAAGQQAVQCPTCEGETESENEFAYADLLEDELIGPPGTPGSTLSGLRADSRRVR